MADDLYSISGEGREAVGRRTKRKFTLGQEIQVEVYRVDRFKRQIDFRVAGSGAASGGGSVGSEITPAMASQHKKMRQDHPRGPRQNSVSRQGHSSRQNFRSPPSIRCQSATRLCPRFAPTQIPQSRPPPLGFGVRRLDAAFLPPYPSLMATAAVEQLSTPKILAGAVAMLRRFSPKPNSVYLDIGAGHGQLIELVRKEFSVQPRVCDYTTELLRLPGIKVDVADLCTRRTHSPIPTIPSTSSPAPKSSNTSSTIASPSAKSTASLNPAGSWSSRHRIY